jgi:putative transposase
MWMRPRHGGRQAAGCGCLPGLDLHHVPHPASRGRGARATPAGHPPAQGEAGAAGDPAERGVSWDITKLLGPAKWTWFYLYVIIDSYSRYVPGWLLARAERASLAERLLADTIAKQQVDRGQLTIHADQAGRVSARRPGGHQEPPPTAHQQRQSLQREPVQDPQAAAEFPDRFGSYEDALAFCRWFFGWYNDEHRHSGVGFHTPADVHYGRAELVRAQRARVLDAAYAAHPERFVRKPPAPPELPTAAWINKPEEATLDTTNP